MTCHVRYTLVTQFSFSAFKKEPVTPKKRASQKKPAKNKTSSPFAESVPIPLHNHFSPIATRMMTTISVSCIQEDFPMLKTQKRKRIIASRKGIYDNAVLSS